MSRPVQYSSDTAFRQALESRLMNLSRDEKVDIQRLRRQVAFDRFLCRFFHSPAAPWALKGGYAMELRLTTARTTRDIDLTFRRPIAGSEKARNRRILEMIQDSAALDLGDCFVFLVGESIMDLDGAPYGGERFPVAARMDGRLFTRFHLDVGVGDAVLDPLETVHGRDWLQFAGISETAFPVIPREQQFAEKYHAYTRPRDKRENSRVRDLVDMLLLIHDGRLDRAYTLDALQRTFCHRGTHSIPADVPPPPASWVRPFSALAKTCDLREDCNQAHTALIAFLASCRTITPVAPMTPPATRHP